MRTLHLKMYSIFDDGEQRISEENENENKQQQYYYQTTNTEDISYLLGEYSTFLFKDNEQYHQSSTTTALQYLYEETNACEDHQTNNQPQNGYPNIIQPQNGYVQPPPSIIEQRTNGYVQPPIHVMSPNDDDTTETEDEDDYKKNKKNARRRSNCLAAKRSRTKMKELEKKVREQTLQYHKLLCEYEALRRENEMYRLITFL